jgi:dihydroorotase-like cyclic amidohydrolase
VIIRHAVTVPGAILIENEKIKEVIESEETFEYFCRTYPEFTWIDYSEYFVSPGIIDLNVCFNCEYSVGDEDTMECEGSAISENSSCLTSSVSDCFDPHEAGTRFAVAGGVTLVVDNPGLFSQQFTSKDFEQRRSSLSTKPLYCDFGLLASLSTENLDEVESLSNLGALGFKSFMLPPGQEISYLQTDYISRAMQETSKMNKPLFFHPEKTNERFLYMSSPFRNESLATRKFKPEPVFAAFPGAFPEEVEGSGSEVSPISSSGSTPMRLTPLSTQSRLDERVLEKQIIYQSNNLESLIKAEISTYSSSGQTIFEPDSPVKAIPEISPINYLNNFGQFSLKLRKSPMFESRSPVKALPMLNKTRRPPPITCARPSAPKENKDYKTFLANCPPHWEVNGVQAILNELKKVPEARVHINNLSSATAVYAVRKFNKENDSSLTCETAAFYLYFSDEHIKPGDTRFKASPPIREEKNRKLMIEILNVGGIQVVSSYHRGIRPSMKFLHLGDFKRALSGIPAIGTSLMVLNETLNDQPKVSACRIAKMLSENPANVLGLEMKGTLAPGKHADVVVWDPFSVGETGISMKNHLNPFQGEKMRGKVICTYVRGKVVYFNGNFWPCGKLV